MQLISKHGEAHSLCRLPCSVRPGRRRSLLLPVRRRQLVVLVRLDRDRGLMSTGRIDVGW